MDVLLFAGFIVLVLGFSVSLFIIHVSKKRSADLLRDVDQASKLLVRKDRELTLANLDLMELNKELNEIAKILVGRDLELTRSHDKLLELDEIKSKFVSTAAHQLRTPLTAIKWSLQEISEGDFGKLKKNQEKVVNDIIAANNRLISLVNDLLDVSRLEEGREIFEMQSYDVALVLKEVYNRFKSVAESKGLKFVLETGVESLELTFDKEKIIIAISNLVDNAIKYTLPGGKVSIKLSRKEKKATVEVADTGIGIPKEDLSRVFNRFFRAHNAMLLETYGSGLGLSVVKDIVEKHNGSITLKSEEGKGTVFTIALPAV